MGYELCKYNGRWAIYCKQSRTYYFGKKASLVKRLKQLNGVAL